MTSKSATLRMPQRRVYSPQNRRRRKARPSISFSVPWSMKTVAAVFLTIALISLSFFASYKIRTVAMDTQVLEARYLNIQKENALLSEKYSSMTSRKRLAVLGKKLGLHAPAKEQVVTLY